MNLYTLTDKNGDDILPGGKVRWWSKRYRTHFEGVVEKVTMSWKDNYILEDGRYQKRGGEVVTTYHIIRGGKLSLNRRITLRNVKLLESLSEPLYNT